MKQEIHITFRYNITTGKVLNLTKKLCLKTIIYMIYVINMMIGNLLIAISKGR